MGFNSFFDWEGIRDRKKGRRDTAPFVFWVCDSSLELLFVAFVVCLEYFLNCV